jgi:hypothetical protein
MYLYNLRTGEYTRIVIPALALKFACTVINIQPNNPVILLIHKVLGQHHCFKLSKPEIRPSDI